MERRKTTTNWLLKLLKVPRQFGMQARHVGTVILVIFTVLFPFVSPSFCLAPASFSLTLLFFKLLIQAEISAVKDDLFAYGFGTVMIHE